MRRALGGAMAATLCCALALPAAARPAHAPAAPSSSPSERSPAKAPAVPRGEVPPSPTAWQSAQEVALFALGLIGVDYRMGGANPAGGLDCSGLIRYVFQQVTGTTLPRTATELSRIGAKVSLADLAPGDLVFFNTRRFAFSHVGLYLGGNRFIHAPSAGGEVQVSLLSQRYWSQHFDGARRLVGVLPSMVPTLITSAVASPAASPALPSTIERADGPFATQSPVPSPVFTDGP